MNRAPATTIAQRAIEHGMRTLRTDGWNKVKDGETTIEEVLRVTQIEEHLDIARRRRQNRNMSQDVNSIPRHLQIIFQHGPLAFLQHPAPRRRRAPPLAVRREGRRLCAEPRAARARRRTAARQRRRQIVAFAVAAAAECRLAAAGKYFSARRRTAPQQFR